MTRAFAAVLAASALSATVSAQQPAPQAARQPARQLVATNLQGFSIVLVEADTQNVTYLGGAKADDGSDIPAAARKAIADLKDFLPFKSYRLLDGAWVL